MRMTEPTEHPAIAAGCTKKQVEAFERIAVGDSGGHAPATLGALKNKGLIEFEERRGSDALGGFSWRVPFVPIPIHAQWCRWCDENISDEDL
jgi:hypothetical protein